MALSELLKDSRVLLVLNVLFAAISIIGQVGQNSSLPLWTGATGAMHNPNCTTNSTNSSLLANYDHTSNTSNSSNTLSMDPFFVVSFASLCFVIFFGGVTAVLIVVQLVGNKVAGRRVFGFITMKDDILFPQWQLFLIGLFDALNGIFVVFASLPLRTAPFLQAILINFTIPLTIFFRLILLRKRPTILKLLCAIAVLAGLIFSLMPVFTGMDQDSQEGNREYLAQSRRSQILWPLCFMFGFVPAAVMNVIEEKSLKDRRKVNLFYLLFCTSLYQLILVWTMFWTDIIPGFGFTTSLKHFGENYKFALHCFFGGAGCSAQPGVTGTIFIVMYIVSYIGGALLLRYSEGATYLAIVQSLVTPLGALFWSIFSRDECAHFSLKPHGGSLTYFSIAGMAIMVPAIFLYNIGTFKELKKLLSINSYRKPTSPSETTPLINDARPLPPKPSY